MPSSIRFSIICATRGRPALLRRMLDSVFSTANHPEQVQVILRFDNDDVKIASVGHYRENLNSEYVSLELSDGSIFDVGSSYPNVFYSVGPRYRGYLDIGKMMNEMAPYATGEYLMMGDDDTLFVSKGWDDALYEVGQRYTDGIICLAVSSRIEPGSLTTCISRRWYETVGFFVSPNFPHPDSCLHEIARKINRLHIVENVQIDHEWVGYNNPNDQTFKEGLVAKSDPIFWSLDAEWERQRAAQKLEEIIKK